MKVGSFAAIAALCCMASPAFAQQLTRVQVLALQQQLRDDGCGIEHTTGHLDAMTRRAVEKCKSKYNVSSGGAAALLDAMNIGFGPNDHPAAMATAMSGDSTGNSKRTMHRPRRMRGARGMQADTTMKADSMMKTKMKDTKMKTKMKRMMDTMMKSDSTTRTPTP